MIATVEAGGFFTRRAFKVGAARRNAEITVDAAAGLEGGQAAWPSVRRWVFEI